MNANPAIRTGIASAVAVLALLAGCGSTGGGKTDKPESAGGSVEDQLGFSRQGIQAAQPGVENDIAACMKAQGFDYVPVDPVAAQAALTGKPNLTDKEFERQFGYGISTLYGRGSEQSDPNARIRSALSPADQRAYDLALSGGRPEQTFSRAVDTGEFTELGGCTKQATDRLFGGAELLTTLQRKLDELDDSIVQDQRMVRAKEEWATCMRVATGQPYEDAEDVESEITTRLKAIVGTEPAPGTVTAEGSYDRAALAKLQQDEIRLSSADLDCEKQHITPVEDTVRAEKERVFRDVNADLLRRVKPLGQ